MSLFQLTKLRHKYSLHIVKLLLDIKLHTFQIIDITRMFVHHLRLFCILKCLKSIDVPYFVQNSLGLNSIGSYSKFICLYVFILYNFIFLIGCGVFDNFCFIHRYLWKFFSCWRLHGTWRLRHRWIYDGLSLRRLPRKFWCFHTCRNFNRHLILLIMRVIILLVNFFIQIQILVWYLLGPLFYPPLVWLVDVLVWNLILLQFLLSLVFIELFEIHGARSLFWNYLLLFHFIFLKIF